MDSRQQNMIQMVEPPPRLLGEVLLRVSKERRNLRWREWRLFSLCLLSVFSLVAIVPVVQTLLRQTASSGFAAYLSLLVTDRNVIFSSWRDFSYSLLEALPLSTLIVMIGLALMFLASFRSVLRQWHFRQLTS